MSARSLFVLEPSALVYSALGAFQSSLAAARVLTWPSPRYRDNPIGFFRDILGAEPWEAQRRVLNSVRDHPRTTWKSGHRVSKSHTCGGMALWFYCSFDDARVVMSAPVARSVDGILWRQTAMMKRDAGICVECVKAGVVERPCPHSALIDGKMGKRAATGLESDDFREIKGYTARDVEAITGTAGKNLFFEFDECSGIPAEIFEGLEGNRAGWSEEGEGTVRVLYTGNPTKTSGEFYESHNGKSEFFNCITTSSEDTPNCRAGRVIYPGLATRQWVEEKKRMWGEDSPLYLIRVKGEFAENEDGKIFSVQTIMEAEERWPDANDSGRLFIGVDPAGESGLGDEAAFASRRADKILRVRTERGLSAAGHLAVVLQICEAELEGREKAVVVLDREGEVGAKVYGEFQAYLQEERNPPFELVAVRASDRAVRQPRVFGRVRDELTSNIASWIRDGGALPEDAKLAQELHVWEWEQQADGRLKLIPNKRVLRRKDSLGRSPDRYDACALSCWVPLRLQDGVDVVSAKSSRDDDDDDDQTFAEDTFDPYAGNDWREG